MTTTNNDRRPSKRYGLTIPGDIWAPVFRKGDIIYVDPDIPFLGAVDCEVVISKKGGNCSERNQEVLVGTLVAYDKDEWTVKTYGPRPRLRRRKRSEWPICEYITWKYCRPIVGLTVPAKDGISMKVPRSSSVKAKARGELRAKGFTA
jgi:hypothetical protein